MGHTEMRDLERLALDQVGQWISARRDDLARSGKRLLAVVAFGPVVQHTSMDELNLIEVVEPQEKATTQDITETLALDPRLFGRVGLVSISRADLEKAISARTPLALNLLLGFKVLVESKGLGLRRRLGQNAA